jgi:glycine/D-amino acid oxidase-like deaminating enzyme
MAALIGRHSVRTVMIALCADGLRLHSGTPWWLIRNGTPGPAFSPRLECGVAIVGAGLTGALVADALSAEGLDVVLIDRRPPATGSTAASTALLMYELDLELGDLIDRIGTPNAVRAYQLSVGALATLERVARSLDAEVGFARRSSLYLAARAWHRRRLVAEDRLRRRFGFDSSYLTGSEIATRYGIAAHGALRTDTAGVVDPVRLVRALLRRAQMRGAGLWSETRVLTVAQHGKHVLLATDRGPLRAEQAVLAFGYEIPPSLQPDFLTLQSTFALVTEPVAQHYELAEPLLLWESARPYAYLRPTEDHRILIGGADAPFRNPDARDRLLAGRTRRLERKLRALLPAVRATTAYSWAGTFGTTADALPVIGTVPGLSRVYYALGYGGNGVTFSAVAADLLRDLCLGKPNADAKLFRADR